MAAVFAFDESEMDMDFGRSRRRSVSSVNSREDIWAPSPLMDDQPFAASEHLAGSYNGSNSIPIIAEVDEAVSEITDGVAKMGSYLKNQQFMPDDSLGTSYQVDISSDYIDSNLAGIADGIKRKMTTSDFEYIKVLGKGAYGKVLLVREKATGRLYAQKQLKKASMMVRKKLVEQTKTERAILESVRHPYIVKLFYALQDQHRLYLFLEYAQGGELFSHLASEKMLSEPVVSFYAAELVLALTHLHTVVGVVYRDLKPENCLLDSQGHLVLTDFGLSKVSSDGGECKTFLGTPEYMAPEILLGKPYDFAVDWWSLGALCYDLLTGTPPFTGNNYKRIVEKIQKTKLVLPYYITAEAKDFLTRLLRKEPKKRLGGNIPDDLSTIRKHRFFRRIDWAKLERRDPSVVPPIVPIITNPILAENFSDEFTSMALSPPGSGLEIPGADQNGSYSKDDTFANFTFTASNSFIENAMNNVGGY
ncbi:kinase-like domain-containing protein [Myxozyma melibiosi]|uniref:Kinase-like domain-containing protein n=1 Tax=Myxozyma melibiosi TaxID=54550 RepID=A0ABR1F9T2_9ASCO